MTNKTTTLSLEVLQDMAVNDHAQCGDVAAMARELLAVRKAQENPLSAVPEWSNEQCLEFLSVAFRHASISGDVEMDDIRLGIKMANKTPPSITEPALPDGWKLVPVEPTMAMCEAMYRARDKWHSMQCDNQREMHLSFAEPRYLAALAAAPAAPGGE